MLHAPGPELLAPSAKVKIKIEVENPPSFLINRNYGGQRRLRKFIS